MCQYRSKTGGCLDSTRVRSTSPSSATATSAGQARDDDAEQRDDGIDDGLQSGGNGVNNGHDAVADRAEDGLDLKAVSEHTLTKPNGGNIRKRRQHPCLRLCDVRSISVVLVMDP